jgi:splicing factor 3B subunit 5
MATLQDRFNINSQLEHLQTKYVGTGTALITLYLRLCKTFISIVNSHHGWHGLSLSLLPPPSCTAFTKAHDHINTLNVPLIDFTTLNVRSLSNSAAGHWDECWCSAGHPDITRFEWAVNIHRDSQASYIGRPYMMSYFSAAENEAVGRVRYNMLHKMLLPCGYPPKQVDEDADQMSE